MKEFLETLTTQNKIILIGIGIIFYLIIRFPMEEDGNITTVPMLVCVTSENIITMCKRESKVIAKFIVEKGEPTRLRCYHCERLIDIKDVL